MNKIFKVIWSKARNCYVVVSELAKSHDDGHVRRSRSGCCRKAAVLAAWVLTMGVNGAALAADMPKTYTKDNVEYTLSRVSGLTGVYYDSGKTKYALITYSDNNYNDKTTKTVTINDIAKYDTTSTHDYSVSPSGEKSTDGGAIIDSNYTNTGAIGTGALAAGVNALAAGTNSVAIGTGATAAGNGATVIGQYASASGQYATAFGGLKTKNSRNKEVIYYRNEANGDASVAFGEGTKANGEASLAFGHNTIAGARGGGQQSVAFGESTKALGGRSLAFGENTMAEFNDSVAFGNASRALSTGSLAHGNRTNAVGQYSTSWGNNTVAAGENATVFGTDAMAGAIDENGAIIIIDNNNNPVKIDKNGYKAFIDTNGKTQSVTYPVTNGETHKYLVLTDANNKNTYICDYRGNIHQITYDSNTGKIWWERDATTSDIAQIDPGSNGYQIYGQKNATAFGNATRATAAESTAWGQESIASGEASTAFGIGSKAEGKNSLAALGGLSANENSIAIGQGTKANNDEEFVSAAIGQNAVASGKKSLALGFAGENAETSSTVASGENALALGTGAQALAKNSISIGAGNKVLGEGSGAIGDPTDITGTGSYELGNDNGTYTENAYTDTSFNAKDSGIFGNKNKVHGGTADSPLVNIRVVGNNNTVTASNALVLGNNSTVPATGGIAIGNSVKSGVGQYNNTFGSNTTAIGNESQAYHDNAVAIGTKSKATGTGSIAIGDEASTLSNQGEDNQPNDAIAIGTKAKVERGDSSIAIGKNADILADGKNTQNNIAIGTNTYIRHGSSSVVMGNAAQDNSDAGSSIVLGNGASVANSVASNGIAIGTKAEVANTNGGVAIGNGAKATNSNGGDGSPVAVGQSAEATGTQAVAIGYKATASGNQVGQTVVGSNANATANYGTIIGYGATGTNTQANQTAIGYLATTNAAGGVALGANSNSDRPYDSTSATSPYIPTGASDEQTKRINDTKATTGAVSVGYTDSSNSSKNVRRQIINVAAGKEDTDAVNVAQLKAVQSQSHDIAAEAVKVSAEGIIPINGNYVGGTNADGNILANVTTNNGAKVYDLKLNKDVVLGEKEAKKGGSITVNNVDQFRKSPESTETYDVGEAVKIDGKTVSIVKVGKADAETGETNEQRQVVLGIGQDTGGYIALNDSTGKKHTYIYNAISDGNTYLDSDTSKQFNRLEYSDYLQRPVQFIATLDDGMKYAGDDVNTTVAKKLNSTLQIRGDGTYDETTKQSNGNIQTSVEDGTIKVALNDKINLHQNGSLTVGGDQKEGSATADDPIVIKHFDDKTLDVIGVDKDGKPTTSKEGKAGDYVTGLDNKDWNVSSPTYVSGRAATEDQLKKVSDAVNSAAATAGKHTVVTVNDKDSNNETKAEAGTGAFGNYAGADKGNLLIAAKNDDGQMTYNIKLNDQLAIGQKGEPGVAGKDGKDGKVTVETKGGTTVVIGHDGEPGKDGKDGLFVTGKDGADGVSITGPNGADGTDGKVGISGTDGKDAVSISGKGGVGHIGLTGPKGADGTPGKDGISIDITTDLNTATLDDGKNVKTVIKDKEGKETTIDQAPRIQYKSGDNTYEVATMDDGLKFVGNDGKEVTRKLNSTLSLTGGITDEDALQKASGRNLGVRSNKDGNGLEIVMTDTPDFTKVTVGEGTDMNSKITIGKQTVTGKKSDGSTADQPQTGNYITGLDNKAWNKDNVVENRAATEGQLRDIAGSITNQTQGGGFALTSDEKGDDKIVKQDLGKAIQIKGDTTYKTDGSVEKAGNIKTSIDNGAIKVGLNKDVDLGNDGSVKAGNTTIDKDGVETNKVKVGDITITDQGINGGSKQITNIASGLDSTKHYADSVDNNAASIGDVKQLAQQEAQASAARSGKNIIVKNDHTVNLNDHITLGDTADKARQVDIDGTGAKVTAGDGDNKVTVDGSNGQVVIGTGDSAMTLGQQANGAGDNNPATGNFLNGLDNRNWDGEHIQSGRAATEDQLKTVSDKVNSGRVFQGDDGKEVKVGMGDTLKIQGGVKAEDVSKENNIGIVKGADDTLNIRLAKDIKGLDSVTTGNTTIDNGGLTVKTGDDSHDAITIKQGNVNMGGNKIEGVAPGKVSQDSTDAVNGSQLWQRDQAINGLSGSVNKLGNRINRVGAGAAALAALHPLDFDPDDKWDFAAGYGNYRGANAAAVGAYYRPNEDTMFSVGGSFGGGENMVNAGVSIKLGQGNHVSTSRVAMAKEIKDLRQNVANLNAIVNRQSALIDKLTGTNAGMIKDKGNDLFPDVPANHWAYEYVTKLKHAGILTGYPDGNFDGDRMMTRYEFAAIVYRAIMAGAASNPALNQDGTLDKLANEFSSEMKYIRIDTIAKDKNGKPTIERVRVISDAK